MQSLDEAVLDRWLRAESFNVDKAEKRLRAHATWREAEYPEGKVLEACSLASLLTTPLPGKVFFQEALLPDCLVERIRAFKACCLLKERRICGLVFLRSDQDKRTLCDCNAITPPVLKLAQGAGLRPCTMTAQVMWQLCAE